MAPSRDLGLNCMCTAMHASCCAAHHYLCSHSLGTIAFQCDMSLDIPLLSDILTLQAHCQTLVDWHLLQNNASCVSHDYIIGEQVLKKNVLSLSDKLQPSLVGPLLITQVHTNGTCTICLSHNVLERINIRQLKPYKTLPESSHGKGE